MTPIANRGPCDIQNSGLIELYFYGELETAERAHIAAHLRGCAECSVAVEELKLIREALAARPDVSGPATGEWSEFMTRLDAAVAAERRPSAPLPFRSRPAARARAYAGFLATAALLALVTASVWFVAQGRGSQYGYPLSPAPSVTSAPSEQTPGAAGTTGLRSAGEMHFERSKLVVLGLATRDSGDSQPADWAYERALATSLLNDTRLYRQAAEQRGLASLAGVMRDLEVVLLQTAMSEEADTAALTDIQRLIQKRGLIGKMDGVATVGM